MLKAVTGRSGKAVFLPGVATFFAALLLCSASPGHARSETSGNSAPIAVADLPPQGRETYLLIQQGGPFPYDKDGARFGNRERLLPSSKRGYYLEYTVKTPGARNRGARRIICGGPPKRPDSCYYTSDHYASFRAIVP